MQTTTPLQKDTPKTVGATEGKTTNNPLQRMPIEEEDDSLQINPLQLKQPANNPLQLMMSSPVSISSFVLTGDFLNIYTIAAENESKLIDTSLERISSTLKGLQNMYDHANEIAQAENPRTKATEFAFVAIEDGFEKGITAERIKEQTGLITVKFKQLSTLVEKIDFINNALKNGNPCMTGRMKIFEDYLASKEIGNIIVDKPDEALAKEIYKLWDMSKDSWADFVVTLPQNIKQHIKFPESLNMAKEWAGE